MTKVFPPVFNIFFKIYKNIFRRLSVIEISNVGTSRFVQTAPPSGGSVGLTVRAGLVEEEPAGRVAADQIVDEGQQDEEGGGRSHKSQSGQPLGEGCHQVGRQVTGERHTHTQHTRTHADG